MAEYEKNSGKWIKLCALWLSEKGNLTGSMDPDSLEMAQAIGERGKDGNIRVLFMKNNFKEEGSRQPDYHVMVHKDEEAAGAVAPSGGEPAPAGPDEGDDLPF